MRNIATAAVPGALPAGGVLHLDVDGAVCPREPFLVHDVVDDQVAGHVEEPTLRLLLRLAAANPVILTENDSNNRKTTV